MEFNTRVEPSQETEPLRHVDAGKEVGEGSIGRDEEGRVRGGFSRSKTQSRIHTTEASRCSRGMWEGTGGPPR
jgi:hypothetical protein